MLRTLLKSKIHRARVTQADLNYIGSITIDQELMEGADLLENEQVDVLNITNGARLTTYAIAGPAGSGVIGINGAAAHLCSPGDVVIICSYGQYTEQELHRHQPLVLMLDENNHPVTLSHTAN